MIKLRMIRTLANRKFSQAVSSSLKENSLKEAMKYMQTADVYLSKMSTSIFEVKLDYDIKARIFSGCGESPATLTVFREKGDEILETPIPEMWLSNWKIKDK